MLRGLLLHVKLYILLRGRSQVIVVVKVIVVKVIVVTTSGVLQPAIANNPAEMWQNLIFKLFTCAGFSNDWDRSLSANRSDCDWLLSSALIWLWDWPWDRPWDWLPDSSSSLIVGRSESVSRSWSATGSTSATTYRKTVGRHEGKASLSLWYYSTRRLRQQLRILIRSACRLFMILVSPQSHMWELGPLQVENAGRNCTVEPDLRATV